MLKPESAVPTCHIVTHMFLNIGFSRLKKRKTQKTTPVFYVDAAAVNAKISDEKREAALDFLNMITGKDLLVRASVREKKPLYLLAPDPLFTMS